MIAASARIGTGDASDRPGGAKRMESSPRVMACAHYLASHRLPSWFARLAWMWSWHDNGGPGRRISSLADLGARPPQVSGGSPQSLPPREAESAAPARPTSTGTLDNGSRLWHNAFPFL